MRPINCLIFFLISIIYFSSTECCFPQFIKNVGLKISNDFITTHYDNTYILNGGQVGYIGSINPFIGNWHSFPTINLGLLADIPINKYLLIRSKI